MKKAYLLAYSDSLGTREQVKECLDGIQEIEKWRYDMPHTFYIISEADAETLAERMRANFQNNGRFVISEFNPINSQGWLTKASWHLLSHHEYLPE